MLLTIRTLFAFASIRCLSPSSVTVCAPFRRGTLRFHYRRPSGDAPQRRRPAITAPVLRYGPRAKCLVAVPRSNRTCFAPSNAPLPLTRYQYETRKRGRGNRTTSYADKSVVLIVRVCAVADFIFFRVRFVRNRISALVVEVPMALRRFHTPVGQCDRRRRPRKTRPCTGPSRLGQQSGSIPMRYIQLITIVRLWRIDSFTVAPEKMHLKRFKIQ